MTRASVLSRTHVRGSSSDPGTGQGSPHEDCSTGRSPNDHRSCGRHPENNHGRGRHPDCSSSSEGGPPGILGFRSRGPPS